MRTITNHLQLASNKLVPARYPFGDKMSVEQKGTVLVTGVTGYIGHHCAAELLRQGYNVKGTVRNLDKTGTIRDAIKKVSNHLKDNQIIN